MVCACRKNVTALPPDPLMPTQEQWGPLLWCILHRLSLRTFNSTIPAKSEMKLWKQLLFYMRGVIPCSQCQQHFSSFLSSYSTELPLTGSTEWIKIFFWNLHNEINVSNGKDVFPYENLATVYSPLNITELIIDYKKMMNIPIKNRVIVDSSLQSFNDICTRILLRTQ